MPKPKTKPSISKTIKLPNSYFERVNTSIFQALMQKDIFEEVKSRYWLCRALDKVMQEAKHYFEEKQKLIRKYSQKYESDGWEKDKEGLKIIKRWKKDDPISLPSGEPMWEDFDSFLKDLGELQQIEIDLGINVIQFDKPPNVSVNEMMLLLPFIEEKES